MQVSKWGNSLAIRLPAAVVDILGLKEGDQIEVEATSVRTLRIESSVAENRAALARLRQYRGTLPSDFRFDRMEANERDPASDRDA